MKQNTRVVVVPLHEVKACRAPDSNYEEESADRRAGTFPCDADSWNAEDVYRPRRTGNNKNNNNGRTRLLVSSPEEECGWTQLLTRELWPRPILRFCAAPTPKLCREKTRNTRSRTQKTQSAPNERNRGALGPGGGGACHLLLLSGRDVTFKNFCLSVNLEPQCGREPKSETFFICESNFFQGRLKEKSLHIWASRRFMNMEIYIYLLNIGNNLL